VAAAAVEQFVSPEMDGGKKKKIQEKKTLEM